MSIFSFNPNRRKHVAIKSDIDGKSREFGFVNFAASSKDHCGGLEWHTNVKITPDNFVLYLFYSKLHRIKKTS